MNELAKPLADHYSTPAISVAVGTAERCLQLLLDVDVGNGSADDFLHKKLEFVLEFLLHIESPARYPRVLFCCVMITNSLSFSSLEVFLSRVQAMPLGRRHLGVAVAGLPQNASAQISLPLSNKLLLAFALRGSIASVERIWNAIQANHKPNVEVVCGVLLCVVVLTMQLV